MSTPSPLEDPDARGQEQRQPEVLPDAPDFEAVARISTQAELSDLRLTFLHADIDDRSPIPENWGAETLMGFSAWSNLDREAHRLVIETGFVALYAPGAGENLELLPNPKDAPVELHARFRLTYQLANPAIIQDGDAQHFALTNGVLHAYPYWRETVQNVTLRMGLTPLLVGTFKIPWKGDPSAAEDERAHPDDNE